MNSSPPVLSNASRSSAGIPVPHSDGNPDASTSAPRKRKRESNIMDGLLETPVILKPYPTRPLTKPCVLMPVMIISREHVPLSCLDLSCPSGDLVPSRLYESRIKILELERRRGGVPQLLIARMEASGTLYAVELHEAATYTVCKLGDWTDVWKLEQFATLVVQQLLDSIPRLSLPAEKQPPLTTPGLRKAQKEKRIAIEALQSIVRSKSRAQSILSGPPEGDISQEPPNQPLLPPPKELSRDDPPLPAAEASKEVENLGTPAPVTSNGLFDNIRNQYSEALYHSMGSLAYFAKGPLSRARAAFNLDIDANLNMLDLIDFLRSLVMTTAQIDKKFRETIPTVISEMKTRVESSDEGNIKKRKRKMKIGRDGLYPNESAFVRRWWSSHKPELQEDQPGVPDPQIRSHINLLRTRETQLQLILILEILALEPLGASGKAEDSQLPGMMSSVEAGQDKKKRSKLDLPTLVDMHADRLCIWQSTASDEQRLLEDSQVSVGHAAGVKAQRTTSEPLRDFCVDVIMPFFTARLPEVCDSISRKLGGPLVHSPPKGKKAETASKPQRPGAVARRIPQGRPQRTLQKALSNEQSRRSVSRGPGQAIAALRSATASAIPGLKREASEPVSLKSIPTADLGLLQSRSSNQRILSRSNSIASTDELKARRQAAVEAELQNAISALRKPNRVLAGRAVMEAAERRASGGLSQLRKSKKPVRVPPSPLIQVKATPANNHFRDALAVDAPRQSSRFSPLRGIADDIPSSSISMIPSTASRPGYRDAMLDTSAPTAIDAVAATPVRNHTQTSLPRADEFAIPASSPLMTKRTSSLNLGISKPEGGFSTIAGRDMFRTPVKTRPVVEDVVERKLVSPLPTVSNTSIYQRLGWDDDF